MSNKAAQPSRTRRTGRRPWLATALVLLGLGVWQLGGGLTIHAKARLAQVLLERAWQATLAGGTAVRPWPWADTWPVARLTVPEHGIDQIVLAGASGRSLAFGPGHVSASHAPGTAGHSVLGGHRDTHFAFLRDLEPGSLIQVQRPDGQWRDYRMQGSDIVDARTTSLQPLDGAAALTLVTSYPFDALVPGGPLRYLVFATAAEPQSLALNGTAGATFE